MILYLDLFSGISGDMILGALIDLGVPLKWLEQKLAPVLNGFSLRSEIVFKHHLRAVNLFVDVEDEITSRTYMDIRELILSADLPEWVKKNSLRAFEKIAKAESRIHGQKIETVHFHEIGGIDSLVDIIGSFLAMEYLGVKTIIASKVPLGSGFVDCAHGRIPVPVPATLAILTGIPVTGSDATTEIVTPTGAAIVATLAKDFGPMPEMEILGIGYGAGKRETNSRLPNLLRMVLGRAAASSDLDRETVFVVKTNVDDMNPEILGFVMDLLLEQGALDVSFTPVYMKKNRPGTLIEVICRGKDLGRLSGLILTQTTAIGLRYHACERAVLEREVVTRETSLGPIMVKKITNPEKKIRFMPEYEACKKIAIDKDLPLQDVYARIMAEVNPLDRV
ncbi:MAG: nickel pincer cofactor biosynthesis protein LarC [Desulfobacteraceae bacterium]|nr:nickel pincer cofactor biosynthesis protein LarC [Desulfobacteraceae bacterium]